MSVMIEGDERLDSTAFEEQVVQGFGNQAKIEIASEGIRILSTVDSDVQFGVPPSEVRFKQNRHIRF